METNRTWKHYQLEERVTRTQTYIFVFFVNFLQFVNVVIFFCFFFFSHLKDFTLRKDVFSSHFTFSVVSYMSHIS